MLLRSRLKKEWDWLWHSQPGDRFQRRYRRTRRDKNRHETAPRVVRLVLAILFLVFGVCFAFLPFLPGFPFLVISGALFASESLALARALDRLENRLHQLWQKVRRKTGLTPAVEKSIAAVVVVGSLLVATRFCYTTFCR